MTNTQTALRLAEYIEALRKSLGALPPSEGDDIAEEIRMHVRERLASDSALKVDQVLAGLGSPQALAREFQATQMLERASRSYSPLLMLRATLRWALTGFQGFLMFEIAVTGYAVGIGFLLLAFLKEFFPDIAGLWIGPHLFEFGFRPENARLSPAHELLGPWLVPLCVLLGTLFTMGTTKLLRLIISRFRKLRLRLSTSRHQLSVA